jgi:preprotein translocase subunit YajC
LISEKNESPILVVRHKNKSIETMNWIMITISIILIIGLLAFTIIKNRKDEKEYEQQLNDDFLKKEKHEENL